MYTSELLIEGEIYTRKDLCQRFNITDATVNNGIFRPAGHDSIWLFVTEQKGKDLPQLYDHLEGDTLYWDGQPMGRTDKVVIEHEANHLELVLFHRKSRDEFPAAGFRYEGRFRYVSHTGARPTHFLLRRVIPTLHDLSENDIEAYQLEESTEIYREGKLRTILVNKHERNPRLRAAAIETHGTRCQVCGFSFAETYGVLGDRFIEVHHLKPVASYEGEVEVDPRRDMAVLCANCHRMLHRYPKRLLSLEDLRHIVAKTSPVDQTV